MKKYILPIILLAAVIIFAVLVGNGAISTKNLLTVIGGGGNEAQKLILFKVRLPRIVAAAGCGAALWAALITGSFLREYLGSIMGQDCLSCSLLYYFLLTRGLNA